MKVCIAEKPSVAREIAKIVGARTKREGYLEGNGYAVTWTFGHLCTLKQPDEYRPEWKKWNLNTLPMLPEKFEIKLIRRKGISQQFKIIKSLFKKATVIINCGDAGQEGELIQRWVMQHAKCKKPVQRLWVSSLTKEALTKGFQNLKNASQYDTLFRAGVSRALGDWMLGMNATRLYTLKYSSGKQLLSIGRVQTPTLAMIVKRHLEIVNFKPETYWELKTVYRKVTFNSEKGKFFKKEEGSDLLDKIKGKIFKIVSYDKKQGKEFSPRLFDLTALQVEANKKLGLSASQTLSIAQKLYERKIITYPRVDTTYLPTDMHPKIKGILQKMTTYQNFVSPLLQNPITKSSRIFNNAKVTDHHAIIPTGVSPSGLSATENKIYDLIARRFIANFYPPSLVANTTVIGAVEYEPGKDLKFKATGKQILEPGWRVLYPHSNKNNSNKTKNKGKEEVILPEFKTGESGPHDPFLEEKQTKPPRYYTEATLLRAMETAGKQVDDEKLRELMKANGIGRPSTRAAIINILFKRNYIKKQKKSLVPTDIGIQLIQIIKNDLLKSPELTGQWEAKLRQIEKGEYKASVFIKEMQEMVKQITNEVMSASSGQRIQPAPGRKIFPKKRPQPKAQNKVARPEELTCPKCQNGKLLKGKTAYGCSQWKSGCTFKIPFIVYDKKLTEKQVMRIATKGGTTNLKNFNYKNKKIEGKVILNKDFEVQLIPKMEKAASRDFNCPKCGIGKIIKGKTAYGCSNWQSGCHYKVSFEHIKKLSKGKKITKELLRKLLT